MNYQQLYAYLNTRPLEELQDCMRNIVGLTRKRTRHGQNLEDDKISTEEDVILAANNIFKILQKSRISQRVWTEESVLNKFTSQSTLPTDRNDALSMLLVTPKVCNYLMLVDSKMNEDKCEIPEVPTPQSSSFIHLTKAETTSEDEHASSQLSKRARTSEKSRPNQPSARASNLDTGTQGANTPVSSTTISTEAMSDPRRLKNYMPGDKKTVDWTTTMVWFVFFLHLSELAYFYDNTVFCATRPGRSAAQFSGTLRGLESSSGSRRARIDR